MIWLSALEFVLDGSSSQAVRGSATSQLSHRGGVDPVVREAGISRIKEDVLA